MPTVQNKLENVDMERLLWMRQLKKDPVHRKIMHTKHVFVENDNFDPKEAIEAAVNRRKFLLKRFSNNLELKDEDESDKESNDDDD